MRKKDLRLYIPLLVVLLVATGLYFLVRSRVDDTTPPEITVASPSLTVSVTDPETALMEGVTAQDDRDGDVTGLMVVEQLSALNADHTATVTYAAFDHSGNVAKATRTIQYADYTPPVFGLTDPLVFNVGVAADVLSRVTVTDVLDGDISRNLKASLFGESTGLNTVGTHQVTFRATNSMGDTARITIPVDVLPTNTYYASIELTDNLIYLNKGANFKPRSYFKSMNWGSNQLTLSDEVELQVDSDVNTGAPGVYSVAYTARYNTTQAFTRLIVVVE